MAERERWTDETETLVMRALTGDKAPYGVYDRRDARSVLKALNRAGLLVPPGAELYVMAPKDEDKTSW